MKLSQIILLSLSVVLFIIGVHQTMMHGIAQSYFIFMICAAILLYYYRKKMNMQTSEKQQAPKRKNKNRR